MEITNLRWLEREPTRPQLDEADLSYKLHLLVADRLVTATAAVLRQASVRSARTQHKLRFDVPGAFNGRLFECRVTLVASEIADPFWKNELEQKLRIACRENR